MSYAGKTVRIKARGDAPVQFGIAMNEPNDGVLMVDIKSPAEYAGPVDDVLVEDVDIVELEYGFDDPVVGEVSCDGEPQARLLSNRTEGKPWVKYWLNGAFDKEFLS
jgi:hypothetical protein